jgi:hypothetical protein
MAGRRFSSLGRIFVAYTWIIFAACTGAMVADPEPAAVSGFNAYIRDVEARLARQHRSRQEFLAPVDSARLRRGEMIVEKLTPASDEDLPGAMVHHWRGTAFAVGATAADFERLMRDFNAYPRRYAPQVLSAKVISQHGDYYGATMRVRQKHVITVVMDTTYDISFGRLDAQHGFSISRSMRVSEIDSAGTSKERVLNSSEEHGFLWRLNTYWSYEERDGGLYMQIESVSLTRSIPAGLVWAVGPFVESVPRESLEFTLRATCDALRKQENGH